MLESTGAPSCWIDCVLASALNLPHTPDSELILHAYQTWGEKFSNYLLGDFAFVLWDERQRKLLCVKDRFGMRQLYYAQVKQSMIVCNSLDCLRQHPLVSKQLNEQAIGDFLLFGDYTWADKSITAFADIQTLPPAHMLILEDGNMTVRRYWDIPFDLPLLRYRTEPDYLEHFREVFKVAVADRLRTSRVVVAMSGGMDSTAVAATVRRLQKEGAQPFEFNAVTVDFNPIHFSQERYYAGIAAGRLALALHYVDAGYYQMLSPPVPTTRPVEDYAPAVWLDANKKIAELGRVMLTGSAGDNLLKCSPRDDCHARSQSVSDTVGHSTRNPTISSATASWNRLTCQIKSAGQIDEYAGLV